MGTATNSPAVMAPEKSTWPEANWLAVPDFSDMRFRQTGPRQRLTSLIAWPSIKVLSRRDLPTQMLL